MNWIPDRSKPTTFVKISGVTSRSELNGRIGLVLAYARDRGRYVVVLAPSGDSDSSDPASSSDPQRQPQVALKPENLAKAGYVDAATAQYRLLIRPQLGPALQAIRQKTGIRKPEYLAAIIVAVLVLLVYLLGFSRTLLLLSFAMLTYLIVWGPDLDPSTAAPRGSSLRQRSVHRIRAVLRQSGYPMAGRIADNDWLLGGVVLLAVYIFLSGMFPPELRARLYARLASSGLLPRTLTEYFPAGSGATIPSTTAGGGGAGSATLSVLSKWWRSTPFKQPTTAPGAAVVPAIQQEYYYRLGFDDALQQRSFGHSLRKKGEEEDDGGAEGTDSRMAIKPNAEALPAEEEEKGTKFSHKNLLFWKMKNKNDKKGSGDVDGVDAVRQERESAAGGDDAEDSTGADAGDEFDSPQPHRPHRQVKEDYDEWADASPPPPPAHAKENLFTVSNVMSIVFLGRAAAELAYSPTDGTWNWHRARENFREYPTWKLGFIGLAVYRLLKAVVSNLQP